MSKRVEEVKKKTPAKRVEIVSLRVVKDLELIREGSIDYLPRKMSCPQDVVGLCRHFLDDLPEERMFVVCLDTKNQFNNVSTVSVGTLNSSLAHPREIFKVAVASNSSSIIVGKSLKSSTKIKGIVVAHNHPSGDPTPSKEDIDITKRLRDAGDILGIKLLDHIIIGDQERFISLKEMDIL